MSAAGRQLRFVLFSWLFLARAFELAASTDAPPLADLQFSTESDQIILTAALFGGDNNEQHEYRVFGDGSVEHATYNQNDLATPMKTTTSRGESRQFEAMKSAVLDTRLFEYDEAKVRAKLLFDQGSWSFSSHMAATVNIYLDEPDLSEGGARRRRAFTFTMSDPDVLFIQLRTAPKGFADRLPPGYPELEAAGLLFRFLDEPSGPVPQVQK